MTCIRRDETSTWTRCRCEGCHSRTRAADLAAYSARGGRRAVLREDVVEALMIGRRNRINPTRPESAEAQRRLIGQGFSTTEIVRLVGVTSGAVRFQRKKIQEAGTKMASGPSE